MTHTIAIMLIAAFAPAIANMLQLVVSEWIRRRATVRSHDQIAERVVERMNGGSTSDRPTPREGHR
jgi:hypothetical protein